MGISIGFIITYVFGGLTFLPLTLALVLLHAYLTFPHRSSFLSSDQSPSDDIRDIDDDGHNLKSRASLTSLTEKFQRSHEPDVASGYFAVCREYVPGGVNGKPPERTTPAGAIIASESASVYQSMYRSIFDRKQGPTLDPGKGTGKTIKRARNVFFVVLRHGHLMLYEDSEQVEVKHVISLEHHEVSIYGGGGVIPEGELWIKRNAIQLSRKPIVDDGSSKPFYFFSENCSDKEDFYFALLQNQDVKSGAVDNPPRPLQYEVKHVIGLVQKLHSSEEQLQTRWLNAIIGRLFLALYKTQRVEDFIRKKITKKIARVKKPAFLSGIVLQRIDMGESAPHITNPRLRDLTIDGDCCAEADLKYSGNFRLEIAATARIDLGARFKAREVNLVLAVVIKKLNGHALVKFKPAPSNRVWLSFETMPDMEMSIEPIVSSRQITYGIILRAIESRIREVMAETIVLPHWDDSPFIDTTQQRYRGGIWADRASKSMTPTQHTKIPDEAPEDEAEMELDTALASPSPRNKDERIMSMPAIPDVAHPSPIAKDTLGSSRNSAETNTDCSTSVQKRAVPPKALRSRSFASAANPLLSMDNANVESSQAEKNSKQQKDATTAMMAISNRSRPTSPTEKFADSVPDQSSLWENSIRNFDRSSTVSESSASSDHTHLHSIVSEGSSQTSLPPTPTSSKARSIRSAFGNEGSDPRVLLADPRSALPPDKRQSVAAIGAATAAAKKWGWSVLNRNAEQQNHAGPDPDRAGTPKHPIGRGRPLPPPGQPLPFPENTKAKVTPAPTKRKAVPPPALPQRRQDTTKARPVPAPPLPARKRQSSIPPEGASTDEGLLVVEAPPDSEPSSPNDDLKEEFISSLVSEPTDSEKIPSARSALESTPPEKDDKASEDDNLHGFQKNFREDEDTLGSWEWAQEEEARSKSMWIAHDEHS